MFQHLLDFFSINKLLHRVRMSRGRYLVDGGRGRTTMDFLASLNVTNVPSMLFTGTVEQNKYKLH